MPRLPRVHLEGALYYVTLEGPASEPIFKDQADCAKYVELLNAYKSEYGFKLFSYALLPNRLHLLIEPHEEFPISHIMQKLTPTYTKYYNHRYDRKGPLFQKRFRSVIVEKEAHLAELTRYIHKLSSRSELIRDLNEYACTSLSAYTPSDGHLREEAAEVSACLPKDMTYAHYLESVTNEELNLLDRKLSRGAIFGSDRFCAEVRERMREQLAKDAEAVHEPAAQIPVETAAVQKAAPVRPMTLALSGVLLVSLTAFVISNFPSPRLWRGSPSAASSLPIIRGAGLNLPYSFVEGEGVKSAPHPITGDLASRGAMAEIKRNLAELTELSGTVWEVELISVGPDGVERPIRDQIKFAGKAFQSHYFASQGFSPSNYSVTVNRNGVVTWETMQRNEKGEVIMWRGDWQGNKMEGVMSYQTSGGSPKDFSFMSSHFGVQK